MSLTKKIGIGWKFSDKNDDLFYVEAENHHTVLYFPLINSYVIKSFFKT